MVPVVLGLLARHQDQADKQGTQDAMASPGKRVEDHSVNEKVGRGNGKLFMSAFMVEFDGY